MQIVHVLQIGLKNQVLRFIPPQFFCFMGFDTSKIDKMGLWAVFGGHAQVQIT